MFTEKINQIVRWTKLKVRLHVKIKQPPYFREREIWWASIGSNLGSEQDGKNNLFERPVIIVRAFSLDLFWAIPLTSKKKFGNYYFSFVFEGNERSAILSQLRPLSSKRLTRKIRTLPIDEFLKIKMCLKNLL